MRKGNFIVFEGVNGCGKSTQLHIFIKNLYESDKSRTIFVTREPNEFSEYGKLAREMLSADGDPYLNQLKAMEYFTEARIVHNDIFLPLLEKGIDVISDRYYHSTFAFQHAQGISYEEIAERSKKVKIPDIIFILDLPIEEAYSRLVKRGDKRRKFDKNLDFLEKVRQNYRELGTTLPQLLEDRSIIFIDGNRSIDIIAEEIWEVYRRRF